jgi:hypothetical protein
MRRPAALFTIVLVLGTIILAPRVDAQALDRREEGPFEIDKCQTISDPGSYKLVNNLITNLTTTGDCLVINANSVTIDLAGFTISGVGRFPSGTRAIAAGNDTRGITVRNGSISGFASGVDLRGDGSIVEGLRVFGGFIGAQLGIGAKGIVKGNTVEGFGGPVNARGIGISATGIVTGNYVGSQIGMEIGQGSTVIGNTVSAGPLPVADVSCPSNVTNNTFVNTAGFGSNLTLRGDGCNNTNNVVQPP